MTAEDGTPERARSPLPQTRRSTPPPPPPVPRSTPAPPPPPVRPSARRLPAAEPSPPSSAEEAAPQQDVPTHDELPVANDAPGPSLPPSQVRPGEPPPYDYAHASVEFTPLRTDPPPRIFATWWMRYLLFLAQLVGLAVVLMREYESGPGNLAQSPLLFVAYGLVAALLLSWSGLAMINANRLVPPTRYQHKSRASVAVGLWLVAFAAPIGAAVVVRAAQDRFADDPDDLGLVAIMAPAVLVCFLLVWLPFQYHTRHAQRIGAPTRVVGSWFWLPLGAGVGVLAIHALGLHDYLAEEGLTDWDRTLQAGIVFGLPALLLALTTWRATTVFDEVIELRWQRWKTEWEQTIEAMVAQPPPGPEISPRLRRE